jgi:high-affinity nickel-transport protein
MDLNTVAQDLWMMAALALVLGARHGFDADHIAAVDALTRCARLSRSRAARWCGALFSIGHGTVVIAVAVLAAWLAREAPVPPWLDLAGVLISVLFLFALGTLNLLAVLRTPAGQAVVPVGLRGRWVTGLMRGRGPWVPAAIGALFALSFDTLSQATVFAIAGRQAGPGVPLLLALLFTAGMVLTDGANGLWVARLLRGADARAALASRVLGLAVALVSYAVGAMGLARLASPGFAAWGEGRELAFGSAAVLLVLCGFLAGALLSARAPPCPVPSQSAAPGTSSRPVPREPSLRTAP